ncbi:MAG: Lrp/AsnC family transcriptional regulator [Alphaproteobacteria bacterium]|nr:Lrp/AsnC family transcriptional regulator [Alphaproteobacteria bacterium]
MEKTVKSVKKAKLDKIDCKILSEMQENGRITNVELARKVGISAPPCLRRVRALEEAGYIKGYHAVLDSGMLGFGVTVFAMVRLTSQAEQDLVRFEQHISSLPMVRECHMLAGEVDFLLKIVSEDWESYQEFLKKELTGAPNVTSVKSSLCIRESKNRPGIPVE